MGVLREEPAPIATFSTKYPTMTGLGCIPVKRCFKLMVKMFRIAAEFVWGFKISLPVLSFSKQSLVQGFALNISSLRIDFAEKCHI
jgi:hypothetical protein